MDYENFLKDVSVERLTQLLEETPRKGTSAEYVEYLLGLPDDMKVILATRGLMYLCVELNFPLSNEQIWEACSFYTRVLGLQEADDEQDKTGLEYYN